MAPPTKELAQHWRGAAPPKHEGPQPLEKGAPVKDTSLSCLLQARGNQGPEGGPCPRSQNSGLSLVTTGLPAC